jgi:hypothetical protein
MSSELLSLDQFIRIMIETGVLIIIGTMYLLITHEFSYMNILITVSLYFIWAISVNILSNISISLSIPLAIDDT